MIDLIDTIKTAFWRATTESINLIDECADRTELGPVFNGAAKDHLILAIPASILESGKRYRFEDGLLAISGNLPDDIEIEVTDGKLFVDGDTGKRNRLSALVPINYREMPVHPGAHEFGAAAYVALHYPEFESFQFGKDKDPALVIRGHINEDSQIKSNHGIHIAKGFESSVNFITLHEKDTISAGVPVLFNQQFVEQVLKAA